MGLGGTYLASTFGTSLPTLPESSRSGYRNAVMYAVSVMPHSCVRLASGESMLANWFCRALSKGAPAHQIQRSEASMSFVVSGECRMLSRNGGTIGISVIWKRWMQSRYLGREKRRIR